MGKATAAPKAVQQRLCVWRKGRLWGSCLAALHCWGWILCTFSPGLPSFTVNPWGPALCDILGNVLYDSIC